MLVAGATAIAVILGLVIRNPVALANCQLQRFGEIHFNNASCLEELDPFPAWAYEVLFVSKRLAVIDPSGTAPGLHRLDAPNNPLFEDCQPP